MSTSNEWRASLCHTFDGHFLNRVSRLLGSSALSVVLLWNGVGWSETAFAQTFSVICIRELVGEPGSDTLSSKGLTTDRRDEAGIALREMLRTLHGNWGVTPEIGDKITPGYGFVFPPDKIAPPKNVQWLGDRIQHLMRDPRLNHNTESAVGFATGIEQIRQFLTDHLQWDPGERTEREDKELVPPNQVFIDDPSPDGILALAVTSFGTPTTGAHVLKALGVSPSEGAIWIIVATLVATTTVGILSILHKGYALLDYTEKTKAGVSDPVTRTGNSIIVWSTHLDHGDSPEMVDLVFVGSGVNYQPTLFVIHRYPQ